MMCSGAWGMCPIKKPGCSDIEGPVNIDGNASVSGDLGVTGTSEFNKAVYINGQPLSANAVRLQSSGDTVEVAGYTPYGTTIMEIDNTDADSNFSLVTDDAAYLEIFFYNWLGRVRQNGPITGVKFFANTGWNVVTKFEVKIWRKEANDGLTYKLIGASDVCGDDGDCSEITEITTHNITFATPIVDAQVGDFVSFAITKTGATTGQFKMEAVGASQCWYKASTAPATTGFNWSAETGCQADVYTPYFRLYGKSPATAIIGESFAVGGSNTCVIGECNSNVYLDDTTHPSAATILRDRPDMSFPWMLSELLGGESYQNAGIGGQTTAKALARLQDDIIDLHPRRVIITLGWNDVNNSVPTATFQSNMTAIMEALKSADIVPVITLIPPTNAWVATNPKHVYREIWNEWIKDTLAPAYNAIVFDPKPYVSINKAQTAWTTQAYALYVPVVPTVSNGFWYYASSAGDSTGDATETVWCLHKGCTVTDSGGSSPITWTNGGSINNGWGLASWAVLADTVHLTRDGYSAYANGLYKAITGSATPSDKLVSSFPDGTEYGNRIPKTELDPWAIMVATAGSTATSYTVIPWATLNPDTYRPGYDNSNTNGYGCDVAKEYCMPTIPGNYMVNAQLTLTTNLLADDTAQIKIIKDKPYNTTHKTIANSATVLCDGSDENITTVYGIIAGATVYNLTDGSTGVITAIGNGTGGADCEVFTNNKITIGGNMSGGVDNDFDTSDHVVVIDADCGGTADTILAEDNVAVHANAVTAVLKASKTVYLNGVDDWVALCASSDTAATIDVGTDNSFFEIIKVGE